MTQASDSASRRGELARRVCVGGLASALVLFQLVGLAHYFLVAHEICLEHGEFLHSHRAAGSHAPEFVSNAGAALAGANAGGPGAFEHEHCSVFLRRRNPALPGPTLGGVEPQAAAVQEAAPVSGDAPSAVAVLFVAPKSSPPIS